MSPALENQIARLALKLPKLKPLQAKRMEVILDQIYRSKQIGGNGDSDDEALEAELDEILQAELQREAAEKARKEAEKEKRLMAKLTEMEKAIEQEREEEIDEIIGEFEQINPCSVCDSCLLMAAPRRLLFAKGPMIDRYWQDVEENNENCLLCRACLDKGSPKHTEIDQNIEQNENLIQRFARQKRNLEKIRLQERVRAIRASRASRARK